MEKAGLFLPATLVHARRMTARSIHSPKHRVSIPRTTCSAKSETGTDNDASQSAATLEEHGAIPQSNVSRGLVFDLGFPGSWDSHEVGSPVVKRFISDEEERWYMWYHGSSGSRDSAGNLIDSIGLAVSSNGFHWERGSGPVESNKDAGLVMQCSSDWWAFDTVGVRPGEVVVMSSDKLRASSAVYWLFYTGFCADGKNRSLPGLAMSQDGRHWARIEGEHHSGALFDVEDEKSWDSSFVSNPQVVVHETGDLRMYYHSVDARTGEVCIGVARSRDGMKWIKLGKILGPGRKGCFDEGGVMNACVVKKKGGYLMAYEGVDSRRRGGVGIAESADGMTNWKKMNDEEAVLEASAAGWDSVSVGSPCVVEMDGGSGEWRVYYSGVGEDGRTGIGLALPEGGDFATSMRRAAFPL